MDQPVTPVTNPVAPQKPAEGPSDKTLLVIATYVLFFVPLLNEKTKTDPFLRFHMRQSLGLLIAWVVFSIVTSVLGRIELVWMIAPLLNLFLVILWFIAVINACKGKQEPVPVIGKYFDMIKI